MKMKTWKRTGFAAMIFSACFIVGTPMANAEEGRRLETGPCADGYHATATHKADGNIIYECKMVLRCEKDYWAGAYEIIVENGKMTQQYTCTTDDKSLQISIPNKE